MSIKSIFSFTVISLVISCIALSASAQQNELDMHEAMKQSLVYLDISCYVYDQFRPWRYTDVVRKPGTGCAVGKYEVITPTWNLTNAKLIKARRYGQNQFIPVKVKVIDYESNLSLLQLDPNYMDEPLKPLKFVEKFERGAKLDYYWLSSKGRLITGHGYLARTQTNLSRASYLRYLIYVATNTSERTGIGQVYCSGSEPIAIACWSEETKEAGLIPAVIINKFLADASDGNYEGFPSVGFSTAELLDPTMRAYLKMPPSTKHGVYVADVYNLGTGSDLLKPNDVILAIDSKQLNSYGEFLHPVYDRVSFHHLITTHNIGESINFDIWRDGAQQQIRIKAKNFNAEDMLVPYYEYGRQPEYVVSGGFVFQKLTRPYLTNWGKNWTGKVSAHLYHYYRDMAFKPTAERRDIVILSYILPANINLGYKDLGQMVVKKFNGMTIRSIADILTAQKINPESKYDVLDFELNKPLVVIPRQQLPTADMLISKNYGIRKLVNVNQ